MSQYSGHQAESFSDLLKRRAPAHDFTRWIWNASSPPKLDAAEWVDLVVPIARSVRDFKWMPTPDARRVRYCILNFMQLAFTKLGIHGALLPATVHEQLKDFKTWLESLSDNRVVRFCWDLLAHDPSITPEPVWWLKRSGRLAGAISYDNIHLAVSLTAESDAMFWWPEDRWSVVNWDRVSPAYLELLSHSSYLVRAAAAKCLGQVFYQIKTKGASASAPQLVDILSDIQAYESKTPGIAGPFLHGANWTFQPEGWSSFVGDVDMKAWFLETLRRSDRESDVPHILSLEFYAHELFARDPEAITEFLKMGRPRLAVMTATEDPNAIPLLLPTLTEMASSSVPAVSAAIREYLLAPSHHAGLQHLTATEDA